MRQNLYGNVMDNAAEEIEHFERVSASMTIHRNGTDSIVEFDDFDLDALDKIIDTKERTAQLDMISRPGMETSMPKYPTPPHTLRRP